MTASRPRTLTIDHARDGTALGTLVREALALPWATAKKLCHTGRVRVDDVIVTDPGARVYNGSSVCIDPSSRAQVAGPVDGTGSALAIQLDRARLLHFDAHVAVFDKPPGINTVPFEDGERGTLVDRLMVALHRWHLAPPHAPLFVVHRLDRETSGALVFGRSWLAQRHLAGLFRRHDIERLYLALVHGHLRGTRTIDTVLLDNRGDGRRGSARAVGDPRHGRRAVTHVRSIDVLDGATLVACTLETGRQHQIRIHLAEAGHPVLGERVYTRGFVGPLLDAPRVMLHARTLGFTHPARVDEGPVRFEAPLPDDFVRVAKTRGWRGDLQCSKSSTGGAP